MDGAWSPAALLPAVWTVSLGALLLAAMRRWFDAVPARVTAVFTVLVLTLFAPVLAGGKVLLPLGSLVGVVPFRGLPRPAARTHPLQGDLVHQITPWQAEVRHAMGQGRWPLWNEDAGVGMPLMGDPQSQAFQPLVVAGYGLPLAAAVGVTAALRVFVALVGMFLLLRRQGLGEAPALLGSLAYGLSGAMLLWLGWPIANAVAWTPFALYAVVRCHRDGGRRDAGLLTAILVALLLGGHPETVVYAGAAVAWLVIACAWERRRDGFALRGFLVRCTVALALAGMLVAPVLAVQQLYVPQSERAVTVRGLLGKPPTLSGLVAALRDPAALAAWGERVDGQVVSTCAVRALGNHEVFWGEANFVEAGGASVGGVIALLAAASLLRRQRFLLPQEGAMRALGLGCLLLTMQPPYVDRLIAQIPVVGATAAHRNQRLVLLLVVPLVYLAACEVERWRRDGGWRRVALVAPLAAATLVWAYVAHPPPGGAGLGPFQPWWLGKQLAAVTLATGLVVAAHRMRGRWNLSRRTAPWALCAVVAAELLTLHGDALAPGPRRLFYPLTPAIRFLRRHLGSDRLVGMDDAFPPNFAQVYGLSDVRIDNPSRPYDYVELVRSLRSSGPMTMHNAARLERAGARLYDLLGVRYVVAHPHADLGLPLAYHDRTARIYEHPRVLPRLYLPLAATLSRGKDWVAWVSRPRDFVARVLVSEPPPPPASPRWHARRARKGEIVAQRREPARWSARLAAPERRLVATSILQEGGWRVLLDGRPHHPVLANGPLLATWVPGGAHRLELLYRPPRFVLDCLLCALAMAGALAWLLRPRAALSPPRMAPA